MTPLNETHDPGLTSWLASANGGQTGFPIQNLPFAVFRRPGGAEAWRGGVAIGDRIVDMAAVAHADLFTGAAGQAARAAAQPALNELMALGPASCSALRLALSRALRAGAAQQSALQACLRPQAGAEYAVPARIGDYSDFFTSIHHASNTGRLLRPDNPLSPNYHWTPIAYHGRASSIGVSGQPLRRPRGQIKPSGAEPPVLRPSERLDFELELGVFIGRGNALGEPIAIEQAEDHIFGLTLLNDWSARDVQRWEAQPLGPFLAKNFATTISPWIVTLEALAPFRLPFGRPAADPQPLPYLSSAANSAAGVLDIEVEALLQTPARRAAGAAPARIAHSNYRHAYWTAAQIVAHHTVGGCNLQAGDLLGTGTMSGPQPEQACALIELTHGGQTPLRLPDGEQRAWLQDGDAVILRGWCQRDGAARIGFGECTGVVLPALGV
jgi:fumarylacetoacetase